MLQINIDYVKDFPIEEMAKLQSLISTYNTHASKNDEKNRYYEGNISLKEVNLGIALPDVLNKLEIGCAWGAKTVDVLAGMSMFDGFVDMNGESVDDLNVITENNNLVDAYIKACRDELKYGCVFATLSDSDKGVKIRFHSPRTASAIWDGEKGRIAYGFAVIDTAPDNNSDLWTPSLINYYTDDCIWVLRRDYNIWSAQAYPHRMGRPLMEALIWNATSDKPFGRSRIKEPIRRLIQGYVRTIANATIGLEFSTAPQKYILGVTDEQFDAIVNNKFRQYVGSILAATTNPENGEKPSFGQLTQGSITPHVDMLRLLATQYGAATGLTVTDTGVVNDANPTSSEAILAQSRTLIKTAEQLNVCNNAGLCTIMKMALAIQYKTSLDGLTDEQKSIVAHFKNPAMPSIAATADAAIKIAEARQGFSSTDVFLEMIGFSQADIRRIKAQESKARGLEVLGEFETEDDIENGEQPVSQNIGFSV